MNNLAMPALLMMASPAAAPATKDLTDLSTPAGRILGPFHNLYSPSAREIPGDPHPYSN